MSKIVDIAASKRKKQYYEILRDHGLSIPDNVADLEINDGLVIVDSNDGLVIMTLTKSTAYTLLGMLETAKANIIDQMSKQ